MAIDAFSNERASFAERLARLAGGTTWREPIGGYGTKSDHMPDAHAMAAALAFARRGRSDIGPDVAYAVICQRPTHRRRVVTELAAALLAQSGRIGERCADFLPQVAAQCYLSVCTGDTATRPSGVDDRDWILLEAMGCRLLWDAVAVSVRRAEQAYRQDAA